MEVDYYFVRERVASKELDVRFISTEDQVVDIMTTPLSVQLHKKFWHNLNMISPCPG